MPRHPHRPWYTGQRGRQGLSHTTTGERERDPEEDHRRPDSETPRHGNQDQCAGSEDRALTRDSRTS